MTKQKTNKVLEGLAKPTWQHPMPTNNQEKWEIEIIEKLAAIEHERWADWQKYVFSQCLSSRFNDGELMIPKWAVEQWTRQIETPYAKLTESEKDSDRREVNRYFPFIRQEIRQAKIEGLELAQLIMKDYKTAFNEEDEEVFDNINYEISNLKNNV